MYINRDGYLKQLKESRFNGQVKVVTGLRRCGKSFLLREIFRDFLLSDGVREDHIITIALDENKDARYRDPDILGSFLRSRISEGQTRYYVFLDEVQYAISKEEMKDTTSPIRLYGVLNELAGMRNVDVYVTGSNSKFLSKDVMTEFRGRGDVIAVHPLSFGEYYEHVGGNKVQAYEEYVLYGGMPLVLAKDTQEKRMQYLKGLFDEIYLQDISERYEVRNTEILSQLTDDLCSSVGSLTNASKIARTLSSSRKRNVDNETISSYIRFLCDSFLFSEAKRYDIKGKKYFEYPSKFYCSDTGLRNARLNFRQQEESHLMENVIYNELACRGYSVDVGVIETGEKDNGGTYGYRNREIDFVVNKGSEKYYIQSALRMDDQAKTDQELRPLLGVRDFFRKIVVSKTTVPPWTDESGIIHMGIYDFLLDKRSIER